MARAHLGIKNRCVIALVKTLQPLLSLCSKLFFRSKRSCEKSFLIISTTGVGDTLWATPALGALRSSFPKSTITVLTSKIGKEVLEGNPNIDHLFVLKRWIFGSLWILFFRLTMSSLSPFSAILIFHASQRILFPFAALLDSQVRVGGEGLCKGLDSLCTHLVKEQKEHEITRRLRMIKAVGGYIHHSSLELSIEKTHKQVAKNYLQEKGIVDYIPLIGLHPGAKNRFKQWDPSCFVKLGRRLHAELGAQIVVSGDVSEKALLEEIGGQIPGSTILAGTLQIREFGALLKNMALFITNDTGPMHIAFAVGTPTVALFGPTDPALCGPLSGTFARVIAVSKTCSPCFGKKCREPFCLMQITPERVYSQALELLESSGLSFNARLYS